MSTTPFEKLLTISIPTYNRGILVGGLLDSIISQIDKYDLSSKIEVQITNNCSTDNTEEVLLSYATKHPYIHYTKNETNIGLGPNVLKCMYLAKGKYCLLLGDDDRLNPDKLPTLLSYLESHPTIGLLIDTALNKKNKVATTTTLDLVSFLEKYYYFMGNAGVFITRSSYIQEHYEERNFEGNSFSWPQTQMMIMGCYKHPENKIVLDNFDLLGQSEHAKITLYNSFYIWKVAYFELVSDIDGIANQVSKEVVTAAKKYFSDNAVQNLFNILQCGVFVDDKPMRQKTYTHILNNLAPFDTKQKVMLRFISFVLWLPSFISRPLANLFIFTIRGKEGLEKKNNFVKFEKEKKQIIQKQKDTILREFSFDGAKN